MCTRRTILCRVANDEDEKNYDASWRFDWNDSRGLFSLHSFNMCTVCTHYDDSFGLYIELLFSVSNSSKIFIGAFARLIFTIQSMIDTRHHFKAKALKLHSFERVRTFRQLWLSILHVMLHFNFNVNYIRFDTLLLKTQIFTHFRIHFSLKIDRHYYKELKFLQLTLKLFTWVPIFRKWSRKFS